MATIEKMPEKISIPYNIIFLLPGPYIYEDRCQTYIKKGSFFSYREPIEELYAASYLQSLGMTCHIIHAGAENLNELNILKRIGQLHPHVVVISTTYPGYHLDLSYAQKIKHLFPQCMIIARGGQMNFVNRFQILNQFKSLDIIIRGHTGLMIEQIMSNTNWQDIQGMTFKKNNQVIETENAPYNNIWQVCTYPNRDLLNQKLYISPGTGLPMATIVGNSGCPHQCSYCITPSLSHGLFYERPISDILSEIHNCQTQYGIHDFLMYGETFTLKERWLKALCNQLIMHAPGIRWICNGRADTLNDSIVKLMKHAGCWGICIGAESASNATLNRVDKKITQRDIIQAVQACHNNKLITMVYFMIGFPWENKKDINETIRFARQLKSHLTEFFFPYPFPGTQLHHLFKNQLAREFHLPSPYPQQTPVYSISNITTPQLINIRNTARLKTIQYGKTMWALIKLIRKPFHYLRLGGKLILALRSIK